MAGDGFDDDEDEVQCVCNVFMCTCKLVQNIGFLSFRIFSFGLQSTMLSIPGLLRICLFDFQWTFWLPEGTLL